jgi:hypothetical protein
MPEEGVPLTPDEDVLSIDEIVSLAKVFVVSAIRCPNPPPFHPLSSPLLFGVCFASFASTP